MTQWNAHLKILKSLVAGFLIHAAFSPAVSWAQTRTEIDTPRAIEKAYEDAARLQDSRRYYASAAKSFDIYTAGDGRYQNRALAKLTETLILSGLPNAASYFYIKVLQSGDRNAIRSVLKFLPAMLDHVGGDLLRKYLIRSTSESDYDSETRNHFFYFLGKDELLKGDASAALQALNKVSSGSGILAQASYLKGTAQAILGQTASL